MWYCPTSPVSRRGWRPTWSRRCTEHAGVRACAVRSAAVTDQTQQVSLRVADEGLRLHLPAPAEDAVGVGEDVVRLSDDLHPGLAQVGHPLVQPVDPQVEQGRRGG